MELERDCLTVVECFPHRVEDETEDESIKVAIVGKPNAGKSSLLNKITGQQRSIVSNIPGTTRDAIDSKMTLMDRNTPDRHCRHPQTRFGDTRCGEVFGLASNASYRTLRCRHSGHRRGQRHAAQDTHCRLHQEAWKSVLVVINKWDLVEKTRIPPLSSRRCCAELNFALCSDHIYFGRNRSARAPVLPLVSEIQQERLRKISTAQLNKVLVSAQDKHQSPSGIGKPFGFITVQVNTAPPLFALL